eukprot:TRINITY_DN22093_c0_g1_i1.p1 TRINITY_DN22093_c0_g1~~TRINITY_DN22093_c0_g1_i1.p1  ORF type:complete len:253 (+),score=41.77 TRINITY_DN22093_c0_g1_i1:70-759(+)
MSFAQHLEVMMGKQNQLLAELANPYEQTMLTAVSLEKMNDSEKVAEMEETVKDIINLEHMMRNHIQALEKMKRVVAKEDTDLTETFKKTLADVEAKSKLDIDNDPKYREYRRKVWQVHHQHEALPEEADDDLVVMEAEVNLTDPITRSEFVDPVKNTNCGHVYSRESILHHIKSAGRRKGATCPVAGCNKAVSKDVLVDAPDIAAKIKRQKKEKAVEQKEDSGDEYTQL